MATTTTGLATSFITFSRPGASGGGATVTDRDGRIKWAGHNLLTNSESFDASSWGTTAGMTITPNSTVAPDGKTTADTLAFGVSSYHYQTVSVGAVAGNTYTARVWLWSISGKASIVIRVHGAATGTDEAVSVVTLTSTPTLYTVTRTFTSSDTSIRFGLDNRTVVGGDGIAGNVIAWGAHLYRSDLGGMQANPAMPAGMQSYYPTTPRNALGWTEDFSNAAWTKNAIAAFGSGSVSNAAVAPNGLQTADKLVEAAASDVHVAYFSATGIASGTSYTLSVYAKADTRSHVMLRAGGGGFTTAPAVRAQLSGAGSVTTLEGAVTASSITAVGDGWYRVSMTFTTISASGNLPQVGPHNGGSSITYTGDGTSGIYLWGAQLSDSASLDTYVPVYGAAATSAAYYAPRLDFDPVTLAARGLLVEEARTNLTTYSEQFDNAAWNKSGLLAFGSGSTANAATAPTGNATADLITEDTSSGEHRVLFPSAGSAATYTLSVSCKAASGSRKAVIYLLNNTVGYLAYADLSTGAVTGAAIGAGSGSASISSQGNGWYRVTVTFVSPGAVTSSIGMATTGNVSSYAGDGTSGIYIWGAQLEAGSFATSYIPTGSATATRAADVASVSTQAFPYSSTASSIVISLQHMTATSTINEGHWRIDLAGSPVVRQDRFASGANIAFRGLSLNVDTGKSLGTSVGKVATAFTTGDVALVVNGGSAYINSSATGSQVADTLLIGRAGGASEPLNGWVRQITYLPRRISNGELQSRTA